MMTLGPQYRSRTQAWKEFAVEVGSMYTGTMIEDLIGMVAKAETTVEIKKNIEEQTRWMPQYSVPSFEQLYRETLLAGVA